MRIVKAISFCALILFSFSPSINAKNKMTTELNSIANAIAHSHAYFMTNYQRESFNLNTAFAANLGVSVPAGAYPISSITMADATGDIVVTIGTGDAIHKNIRGLVVTMSPQFIDPDTDTLTDYDRTLGDEVHAVANWTCDLDNTTAGVDFATFSYLSNTKNVMGLTEVSDPVLQNIFAMYCANVAVTTSVLP